MVAPSSQDPCDQGLSERVAHRIARAAVSYRAATSAPVAASIRCTDFGLPGFLLLTAPSLECGVESFARHQALVSEMVGGWHVKQIGCGAVLRFDSQRAAGELDRTFAEATATVAVAMLRDILGSLRIHHVCLRHAAPRHWSALASFFNCPVHFDAEENAVVFEGDAMERRPRMSDSAMYRYFYQHAEAELKSPGAARGFHRRGAGKGFERDSKRRNIRVRRRAAAGHERANTATQARCARPSVSPPRRPLSSRAERAVARQRSEPDRHCVRARIFRSECVFTSVPSSERDVTSNLSCASSRSRSPMIEETERRQPR